MSKVKAMSNLKNIWNDEDIRHRLLFNFPVSVLEQLKKMHKINSSSLLIEELKKIFEESKKGSEIHQILVNDFLLSFHHPDNIKNNESGKQLEKKFSRLFGAKRMDDEKKSISHFNEVEVEKILNDKGAIKKLKSNCKDKTDLLFDDLSGISMKCGISTNKEINFGSFEFLNIIRDKKFDKYQDLKERKRERKINGYDCGLGSEAQLKNTVTAMQEDGIFEDFLYRFEKLFSIVFKSDIFFYHKNTDSFDIWILSNEKFKGIIFNDVKDGFNKMRWEGNSIRSSSIEKMKENSDRIHYSFDDVINYDFLKSYFKS